MGYSFVPAARTMNVSRLMPSAAMLWRTTIGVLVDHLDHMFIDMITMGMVKVAIVQIIDVSTMVNRIMAATGSVLVIMVLVVRKIAVCRGRFPFHWTIGDARAARSPRLI
jgi:hypothetical protein